MDNCRCTYHRQNGHITQATWSPLCPIHHTLATPPRPEQRWMVSLIARIITAVLVLLLLGLAACSVYQLTEM